MLLSSLLGLSTAAVHEHCRGMIHRRGTEDAERSSTYVTHEIVGAAIEVHRHLGAGLLESAYESCLCRELSFRDIEFDRQVPVPVRYRSVEVECGYRLDLVVERQVIVEVKAVSRVLPIHKAQVLTYLKLTGLRVALLINFNVEMIRLGIYRISNSRGALRTFPFGRTDTL
jgi:GxxExxY protein